MTGIVKDYWRAFKTSHPERDVRYQGWINRRGLIRLINSTPKGEPVNLIGHSYGAHTAAAAAARAGRPVDLLITIDPVGRSHAPNPSSNTGTWINVTANPSTPDSSDRIASMGGKPPDLQTSAADENYGAETNHADFSTMMSTPTSTGQTIRQRLENSNSSQSASNPGWFIDGDIITGSRACGSRIACN